MFMGNPEKIYTDQSLAAKFLSYHPNLNRKLYLKNNSIITKVENPSFLFASEARADENEGILTKNNELTEEENNFEGVLDEQGLSKPNPDSIQNLVAKQIKIYETKDGDTLKSIAEQNGIKTQTLVWANNLPNEKIKPGWFLKIPPVDGVIHTASNNDTIPDLAKKYSITQEKIIAYNGLENAEDIEAGQVFILPGGSIPKPKVITPAPLNNSSAIARRNARDGKVNANGVTKPKLVDNGTGHIFPWGYCTWYVATRVHVPWGGNAKNWLANARAYGAVVSNTPAVGSIVVTTDSARFGHVAYVESVGENGFTVSEMNYEKFGKVNTRFIPFGSKIIRGFIYP